MENKLLFEEWQEFGLTSSYRAKELFATLCTGFMDCLLFNFMATSRLPYKLNVDKIMKFILSMNLSTRELVYAGAFLSICEMKELIPELMLVKGMTEDIHGSYNNSNNMAIIMRDIEVVLMERQIAKTVVELHHDKSKQKHSQSN